MQQDEQARRFSKALASNVEGRRRRTGRRTMVSTLNSPVKKKGDRSLRTSVRSLVRSDRRQRWLLLRAATATPCFPDTRATRQRPLS